MRQGLSAALRGVAVGVVLLVVAWLLPTLLDGNSVALVALKSNYTSVPELMASYVPELRRAIQLSLVATAGAALLGFVIWSLEIAFRRPTGPGQVARSWRWGTWLAIDLIAIVAVYACVDFITLGGLDSVDAVVANRSALGLAVLAGLLFWLLSLLGTERMIRPAVPCGSLLIGRA